MRKWHRWLGLTLGLFMLFVGTTGILIQGFAIGGDMIVGDKAPVIAKADAKPGCAVPDKPRSPAKQWEAFFKHLHSGETFGPIGTAISIITGFALMFFAVSGLWMYWQMWRRRAANHNRAFYWSR